MKKYVLLAIIVTWSFTSFSQGLNLEPTVSLARGDTLFCWNRSQATLLAKLLEEERYQKVANQQLQQDKLNLLQGIRTKDNIIVTKEMQVKNLLTMKRISENSISILEQAVDQKQKKLKQGRLQKGVLSIGVGVLAFFAIVK